MRIQRAEESPDERVQSAADPVRDYFQWAATIRTASWDHLNRSRARAEHAQQALAEACRRLPGETAMRMGPELARALLAAHLAPAARRRVLVQARAKELANAALREEGTGARIVPFQPPAARQRQEKRG